MSEIIRLFDKLNADTEAVLNNGLGKHIDLLTAEQLLTFAKVCYPLMYRD